MPSCPMTVLKADSYDPDWPSPLQKLTADASFTGLVGNFGPSALIADCQQIFATCSAFPRG
jgi:hypothetical protein